MAYFIMEAKRVVVCFLHKWGKKTVHFEWDSNVREVVQTCVKCGRIRKKIEPV